MAFWAVLFAILAIIMITITIFQHIHGANIVWPSLATILLIMFAVVCTTSYFGRTADNTPVTSAKHAAKSSSTDTDDEEADASSDDSSASSSSDADTSKSSSSQTSTSSSAASSSTASSATKTASTSSSSYSAAASSTTAASSNNRATNGRGVTNNQQSGGGRHYAYKPVPQTGANEIVYVSANIPGRYHKDPNCPGLKRYGAVQSMTLAQAQARGYRAFCAIERYGE